MIKSIIIKVLLMAVVICLLNLVYSHTLYPKDLAEKSKELVQIRDSREATDVYYFGESSNITFLRDDSVKSSISELISRFYPSLNLTNINKNASHAGVYKIWLKELEKAKRLQAVIITLNLRSFNADWIHSDAESILQESLVFSKPFPQIVNRFFLSLGSFDNKTTAQREQDRLRDYQTKELKFPYPFKYRTVTQWDDAMAAGGYLKADSTWDVEKIIMACHYIKGYAFNLNEDNPRVRDFDEIFDWCGKNKINLYLNLMAENVQYADSLVGKDLVFLMRENRDFLVKRYQKAHCKVIDNLENVDGKHYIDQNWTTEHYDQVGRMKIAMNVADTLKSQFKHKYKKAY